MVEVDVQILGGVAVTVFLALIFFGVVVLWDVALALRSVGDKIDKLEDNLDDDLKDIGYALDGMSGAQNGGTQVHLSGGGTISPGSPHQESPSHNPSRESTASRDASVEPGPREAPGVGRHDDANTHQRTAHAGTGHQRRRPQRGPAAPSRTGEKSPGAPVDGASSRAHTDQTEAGAGSDLSDGEDDISIEEQDDSATVEGETSEAIAEHPRADRNRGRFVTSPDVTPWYAMAIDREAIADATSPIAGALESGSIDRTEADASGTELDAAGHASEEPIAAGPADEADQEPIAAGPADEADQEPIAAGPDEAAGSDQGDDSSQTELTPNEESTDALGDVTLEELRNLDESDGIDVEDVDELLAVLLEELGREAIVDGLIEERSAESEPESADNPPTGDSEGGMATNPPDSDASGESAAGADELDGANSERRERVGDESSDTTADDESSDASGDEVPSSPTDAATANEDGLSADDGDDVAEPNADEDSPGETDGQDAEVEDPADGAVDGTGAGETEAERPDGEVEADELSDGDAAVDGQGNADTDESTPGSTDGGTEFTFEELTDERPPEPEVSVDEAVETVNEEEPALSRSSHGVDATAEVDDDSATLVYEFDPETVETTDSTGRLLRYQLRSFADSTGASDVDVTVDGNRIVVDIPDADGADVSRWKHAVVEAIDRTLFLSDNSD